MIGCLLLWLLAFTVWVVTSAVVGDLDQQDLTNGMIWAWFATLASMLADLKSLLTERQKGDQS